MRHREGGGQNVTDITQARRLSGVADNGGRNQVPGGAAQPDGKPGDPVAK
ncbi:MAG TPA: hypothetical protein VH209_13975 [Steroidobacteraceae bacterium]|nr:hypothetical protein [Steroidobacteraceae bacterium]